MEALAHAHWWSFIAPQFTQRYFVIAPDLSGHGDSGRRDNYTMEQWADEVMAGCGRRTAPRADRSFVGHSMGGHVAIAIAARFGHDLAGAIIVDAPVRAPDPESEEGERGRMFKNPKTYPDLENSARSLPFDAPAAVRERFHRRPHRAPLAQRNHRRLDVEVRSSGIRPGAVSDQ